MCLFCAKKFVPVVSRPKKTRDPASPMRMASDASAYMMMSGADTSAMPVLERLMRCTDTGEGVVGQETGSGISRVGGGRGGGVRIGIRRRGLDLRLCGKERGSGWMSRFARVWDYGGGTCVKRSEWSTDP